MPSPIPNTNSGPVDMGERAHLDESGKPRIIRRSFVVSAQFSGLRVDHYLKKQIPRLSRTRLQAIIRQQITRKGQPLKPNNKIFTGDELVMLREAQPEPPCPRTFDIAYSDPLFYVIAKPAGLPVHASARYYFNTLTWVMRERLPHETLQICHRLDKETSGALLIARDPHTAARLKRAFMSQKVRKTYLALTHLTPQARPETTLIDLPLALVQNRQRPNIRMEARGDGLPSQTAICVRETQGDYALVECRPLSGRQHQIRAHLAAVGLPIVGDKLYTHGDEAFRAYCDRGMSAELLAKFQLARQALHAATLEFAHPVTSKNVRVHIPMPADMAHFWASKPKPVPAHSLQAKKQASDSAAS